MGRTDIHRCYSERLFFSSLGTKTKVSLFLRSGTHINTQCYMATATLSLRLSSLLTVTSELDFMTTTNTTGCPDILSSRRQRQQRDGTGKHKYVSTYSRQTPHILQKWQTHTHTLKWVVWVVSLFYCCSRKINELQLLLLHNPLFLLIL